MTALIVGLLYVAETTLNGPWRGVAIAGALLLLFGRTVRESRMLSRSAWLASPLLGLCAILTWSPVLAVLSVLLLPRARSTQIVALTLAALGLHFAWWRYLSVFQLQRIPEPIARVSSWILGSAAYVTSDGIVLRGQLVRFSVIPIMLILVPILTGTFQRARPLPTFQRIGSAVCLAATASFAIAVGLALAGHVHFFSMPWWPLVPLAAGLAAGVLLPGPEGTPGKASISWAAWTTTVLASTLVWQLGSSQHHESLKIAFDEAHGKWETVEAGLDDHQYGRDTVYNYALLSRWLAAKHRVSTLDSPWTGLDSDVLVVKMPTTFYSAQEKRAIREFLERGGLLFVIGDHTNLYGTSLVINDLLSSYGFELEADATVPWDTEHYDFEPAWWQRTRYLRGISRIEFQTAATIRAHHPLVLPVLVGDRVSGEDADYSNERFFGALHAGPEDRQPPLVMAAERRYGMGRIVLFADSTIFSTFSLMSPGNRELFQNIIEEGTLSRSGWRVGLVLLIVGFGTMLVRQNRLVFALALIPPMFALSSTVSRADGVLESYGTNWLEADGIHSHLELRADLRNAHGSAFDDYSTFFAWIARTGTLPRVSERPFSNPITPTIVLNPDREFSRVDLERIERYVKEGGRLLVLDDPRFASRTTMPALLDRFGITLQPALASGAFFDAGPPAFPESLLALPFGLVRSDRRVPGDERAQRVEVKTIPSGLSATLVDSGGAVIAGQKQIGRGSVVVFLRSASFSEFVMGDVWVGSDVSPERRRLYQLAYDLLKLIAPGAKP